MPWTRYDRPAGVFVASLKAGAAVAATAGKGWWLHDSLGPGRRRSLPAACRLPAFAMSLPAGRMSIVTGSDRVKTVTRAFEAIGGIGEFIKKGDRVLLKVNAAFASPAMLSATTNPQLVAQVARLCLQAGAASVVVTDNPINDAASCFALTGIEQAARSAGASVMVPHDGMFVPTSVSGGRLIADWPLLYQPFRGVNKLIGIAPLKHHEPPRRVDDHEKLVWPAGRAAQHFPPGTSTASSRNWR